MKYKKIKITTSLFLIFSLFFSLAIPVFAIGSNDNLEYKITFHAEPVTDIEGLVELAKKQNAISTFTATSNQNMEPLRVEQLIEVREYADGSIEKDIAVAALVLGNGEGLLDQTHSGVDYSVPNYTVSYVLYYTVKGVPESILVFDYTYRVNKAVTTVAKGGSTSNLITSIRHGYRCRVGEEKWENPSYNNGTVSGGQTFTIYSSHSGFYSSHPDLLTAVTYGVGGQCHVDFSDGQHIEIDVRAYF